jgi:hypothetical protein
MTCGQFDNLRNEGHRAADALPADAREHLQHCDRCREMQTLLDFPGPDVELPAGLEVRITNRIVSGLRAVSPLPSDSVLMASLLSLTALVITAGASWLGVNGWAALAPSQALSVFALLAASTFLIAYVTTHQMVPGATQRIAPVAAITAVFLATLSAALLLFPSQNSKQFVEVGLQCWRRGLLVSAGAALLFFPVLRRAAWLSPVRFGAATGCLSGLAGLTVLEICCPLPERGHISVWHVGAALTATVIGTLVAAITARYRNLNPHPPE